MDREWPTCVACAVLSRSFDKTGTTVPDACNTCFDRYCWNGTTDSSEPGTYEPAFKLAEVSVKSGAASISVGMHMGWYVASFAAVLVVMLF